VDKTIYNIYITFGTLPALYAQMNVFLDNSDSYVWTRSGGTFIPEKNFPNNLKYYKKFESFNDDTFFKEQFRDIKERLSEIVSENQNIKLNIFCDDSRVQFIWKIFIEINIEKFVNKFIMISEGNITEYMSRFVNDDYFEEMNIQWDNIIKLLKNPSVSVQEKDSCLAAINNYSFYLSTLNNFEYLIPNLNLLVKNTQLNKFSSNMHLSEMNLFEMYNNLDIKIRECFINNALTDLKVKKSIQNKNNKVLIINGTYNFVNEEISSFIYSSLINRVIDDYKKDYIILYKAHPLFPVERNPEFSQFLQKNNIIVLSEKFPIEIALWEYNHIKVGGFCSTIHSLIPKEQVAFFFGDLNGFSKYIFKDNFYNYYNINLSQDVASLSLKYYYKWSDYYKNLNNNLLQTTSELNLLKQNTISKIETINKESSFIKDSINNNTNNILSFQKEIESLTKEIESLKEEVESSKKEIEHLSKHIKFLEIPIYPIIWIRRKIKNIKGKRK